MSDLKNFENFIYACEGILNNAESSVIEWEEHFEKELWEKNSFIANKQMKKAVKIWSENQQEILTNLHVSKSFIKYNLKVNQNEKLENHINKEIGKIYLKFENFRVKYNMNHHEIMRKNQWFFKLFLKIKEYKIWFDDLINEDENCTYFIKNGKKQMSEWDFMNQTGLIENFSKMGAVFNPTHDFNKLKPFRLENFEIAKTNFLENRIMNNLDTNELEFDMFYIAWLKNELIVVEKWITNNKSVSDNIELIKYKHFIETDLNNTVDKINNPIQIQNEKKQHVSLSDLINHEKSIEIEDNPIQLNLSEILSFQNNLIPEIKIQEVYDHFKILIEKTNNQNQFYLTDQQLLLFIKSTFVDLNPIKQTFNCNGFVKKHVRTIFYKFYFNTKSKILKNQAGLRKKYFNIMNDGFEGFNETDEREFNKTT